jgi:signal transduction histidine kinase
MFVSEGAVLSVLVLVGVVVFFSAMVRERRRQRTQERFLTGATHALKTPLATIRLGLESLHAGSLPAGKQDSYITAMIREVSRLERDIDNLLATAALGAVHRSLHLGPIAAARVQRDPDAMQTVLRNLLDNAAKYSRRGDAVTVRLHDLGTSVRLTIADTGTGMTQDEVEHAFERCYRGIGKDHLGGAGLGLYLVRELVHAHGGEVVARSAGPDRGSELELTLPVGDKPARSGRGAEPAAALPRASS